MNALYWILTAAVFSVPVYMAGTVVYSYAQATGTTWERLVAAFRGSASIMWARMNSLSIGAVWGVGELANLLGAPGVKEAIAPYMTPQLMTGYMLFVLLGAEIARRRTLER